MADPKEYYSLLTNVDIAEIARDLLGDRVTEDAGDVLHVDCPRHQSQSRRSFTVDRKKQCWHCFGCGVGGDVLHLVEFVQSGVVTKGVRGAMPETHRAARDFLARKAGLPPLSQHGLSPDQVKELERRRGEEEMVFAVLTDIAEFYHQKFLANDKARGAFQKRYGISDETIQALKIGYADNDGLLSHLKNDRQHKPRALAITGCFNFDHQDNLHPVFDRRYIFPYWKQGKVVYLIGRRSPWSEDSDHERPKYKKLNVRNERRKYIASCVGNSHFYNEDATLSGGDFLVITEGVTDCISLMERGVPSLSPVTTNFKEADRDKLLSLVRRFDRIYLCQDNEPSEAGLKGAMRTAHLVESRGAKVFIVTLPLGPKHLQAREKLAALAADAPGEARKTLLEEAKIDVNEYFLSHTTDDFLALLKTAKPPIQFTIEAIPPDAPDDERNAALEPLLKRIARRPTLEQDAFLDAIRAHFTAKISKTSLRAALKEFQKKVAHEESDEPTLRELAEDVIGWAGPFCYASNTGWFQYRAGVWNPVPTDHINNVVDRRLDEQYRQNNTSKRQRDEVREKIAIHSQVLLPLEAVMNGCRNLLNVENGMYDVDTGKLAPHDPKYYSTIRLPYPFERDAQCPRWVEFIEQVFPGDPISQRVLQEWFGYCLTPDTRHEKALFCLGEGCNGKTKVLNVLERLVGPANCAHIPLDKIGEDFHTISLFNKLLNVCRETEARELTSSAAFKSIVSGETQEDAFKFRDRFAFPVFARLCFATNHLPRFSDTSRGLYRRILALSFDQDFEPVKDKDLEDKLLSELPGIFQWALVGYRRLRERDDFETPEAMSRAMQDIRRASSSVAAFFEDVCAVAVGSDDQYVTNAELYEAYKNYCVENGKKPFSSDVFFKELRRVMPDRCDYGVKKIGGKSQRVYSNLILA